MGFPFGQYKLNPIIAERLKYLRHFVSGQW